jgi:hypothetical protein
MFDGATSFQQDGATSFQQDIASWGNGWDVTRVYDEAKARAKLDL